MLIKYKKSKLDGLIHLMSKFVSYYEDFRIFYWNYKFYDFFVNCTRQKGDLSPFNYAYNKNPKKMNRSREKKTNKNQTNN